MLCIVVLKVFGVCTDFMIILYYDFSADEFGDVALHEQMIELIDSKSWFDIKADGMKCSLDSMDLVFAATLESGVRSNLCDRLLSRMNFTIMAHPSEESFVKIFSTNLGLTFKACGPRNSCKLSPVQLKKVETIKKYIICQSFIDVG